MTTTLVVKRFDVFEQVRHGFAMRAILRAVYPLVLQAVEGAFRRRVDAPSNCPCGSSSIACRTSTVCAGIRGSRIDCLCPNDAQRRGAGRRQNHAIASASVMIQPTFVAPDVRDVRGEHLIGLGRRKVAVQHVLRDRQFVPGVGCHAIAPLVAAPDTRHAPNQRMPDDRKAWCPSRMNSYCHCSD